MKNQDVTYKDVAQFSWSYWRRQWRFGVLILGLMGMAVVLDVLVPVYTGKLVDVLVSHNPEDPAALSGALGYLGLFALLALAITLLRWAAISFWAVYAVKILYELLTEAMGKVQRFSADWHANSFAGGTVRKITRGMWSFDMFGDTLFMGLFPAAIIMLGMSAMLLIQLPLVGLFTLVMIIIYTAVSIWMSVYWLAPRFRKSAAADTRVGATLADIITGNATVKSFGAEEREEALFNETAGDWRDVSRRAWLSSEAANLVRQLLRNVMLVGMVGLTIWLWRGGSASPGDIALALTSFFIISGYLRDVGMHIANLQKAASEMEDVIAFWKRQDAMRDAPDAREFVPHSDPARRGEIVFARARFAYDGQDEPIYNDFSLRIKPGEKVALVGHSGSGKSTFVKLVQRLYDVQDGAVKIDGQAVSAVTQESLRRAIALVPQEPVLFHRSLAANIAYGRPAATKAQIIAAARKAYAHEFICQLPLGYDTLVGERGVKLSGGERQRVAIARALLADAPILILDEATSSLDSVSEHYIQKALAELMEGRTTITIAHRLATIQQADRILVFEQGRIVEEGRHDELVGREGSRYRQLFEMQALDLVGELALEEQKAAE